MYLKALEIQGFKSFPDKVRLSFEKDVTAIVGPNGSGKSNISDAISWVLGEQRSRALRGNKMEDVIFGGTPDRQKLGFAQVSLILDNSSGAFDAEPGELTVTRRYYRSGDSDYFINKRSVRLKDINSLFMDTGLGRDGYSMIGQGRVDEILSAKSTDRREVFEEAAGISRFRYRREEAQGKLKKTDENLVRINDKISELELSVEPLRQQAEVAKKYLILRDELRGLEISLWMENLDKLAQKSALLREEYEESGKRIEEARQELHSLYDNAESFVEMMRVREEEAEKLRQEINAVTALAAEKESELAVLRTNMEANEKNAQRLEGELQEHDERNSTLSEQIELRRERIVEIENEIRSLSENCGQVIDDIDLKELELNEKNGELEGLAEEINRVSGAAAAAKARWEALDASGEEMLSRAESAKLELARFDERLNAETEAFEECEKAIRNIEEEQQSANNRIAGLRKRSQNREAAVSELQEKKNQLQMEESRIVSRTSLLSEMKKEYEGFSRAVKTIMQEKRGGGLRNIHGTVAELVKVPDDYAVAIETALGDSVQHIVVDREEDGKAGISLLKRRDAGRATFLPLSAIKGNEVSEKDILNEDGIIGLASRLVSYDKRYDGIFKSLLGRVLIAEDLEAAIAVSRRHSVRVKIVTLDGQVMNVGGSMTGGSAARSVGMISRANELEKLLSRQKELEGEIRELTIQVDAARREYTSANYEAELAETELRRIQDELLKKQTELEQRRVLVASLKDTRTAMEAGLDETENLADKSRSEKEAALAEAEEQEARLEELRALSDKLGAAKNEIEAQLDEMGEKLAALKNEETGLKSEREATYRAVAEWESLVETLGTEHQRKDAEITALRDRNKELETEAAAKAEQIENFKGLAAEGQKKLDETLADKNSIEAKRGGNEKRVQEKNAEIVELERAFARIEQRKQAADMEEKQIVDRLWETYELSRAAAQRQRQELESVAKANKRASELKREIGALGTPNLGAIDEFERVNERYTYLTDQRDDITKAKEELEKIISDITKEMEEIFLREFNSINENFQVTFKELFGGGSASLELEDPNDVLGCGVEIRVQPPGKTQKTLTLLSGGERAFVAIAIYFAIMKVRPTPFCVLDEIESALDEKNVSRFADYLRKICHNTQFLVITHRRGSMERADVLYGVTMQRGVSKVLSIDLEEALKKF